MQTKSIRRRGFTLVETVIAIGVLAVLLTGFMFIFAPAAEGIKKSMSVQEADRLSSTLELELVTLRNGNAETSGFNKAFEKLRKCNSASDALLLYQYRGDPTKTRADGTPEPVVNASTAIAGKDYVVQSMLRSKADLSGAGSADFKKDLQAIEGRMYFVVCTQLVFKNNQMELGTPGKIVYQEIGKTDVDVTTPDSYLSAVIAFNADFYPCKNSTEAFLTTATGFDASFTKAVAAKKPIFSRNLAVRR